MRNVSWRAWVDTDDGVVKFHSGEHRWEDLPDDGILQVMVYFARDDGRIVRRQVDGDDYYFLQRREGRADLIGSNRHNPETTRLRYPGAIIKRGRWADDLTWQEVCVQAQSSRSP